MVTAKTSKPRRRRVSTRLSKVTGLDSDLTISERLYEMQVLAREQAEAVLTLRSQVFKAERAICALVDAMRQLTDAQRTNTDKLNRLLDPQSQPYFRDSDLLRALRECPIP